MFSMKIRHVLKNKLNIGREIVIMRCQRVFNGTDSKGNKPIVVNFQVSEYTCRAFTNERVL